MNENIVRLCENAKSILIVIGKQARIDGVAAGLALSLAALSQGKSVHICTEATLPEAQKLVGADKLTPTLDLGGNVLKVAFPYREGAIDKVTYNITDDTFNLLIEPRSGTAPLESKDVRYSYTGGAVDLIFTIDAPSLDALGNIYLDNPDIFVQDKIINIDRRFDNKNYGVENIVEKQASSTSELILRLLELLRWNINPDIATNLYAGVLTATNNFTSFSTNAGSFEAASNLMKAGARKIPLQLGGPAPQGGPRPAPMSNPFGGQNPFAPRMGAAPPSPFGANPFAGAAPFGLDDAGFEDDDFFDAPATQMPPVPAPVMPGMAPKPVQVPPQPVVHQQQKPAPQQPQHQQQHQPQQQGAQGHSHHPQQQYKQHQPERRENKPQQAPQQSPQQGNASQQKPQQEAPADWLKPKIFKSTDLV